MKIICVDNLQRESSNHPDYLIAEHVHTSYVDDIVKFLNGREARDGNSYFRKVADDYKLQDYSPV
jgi:hypothetical protein